MSSLSGLALPLFLICWEVGILGSSAGKETSSEEDFWITDVTETAGRTPWKTQTLSPETSAGTFVPASATSKVETRNMKTISLATETKTLSEDISYSQSIAVISKPAETSATSDSITGTEMTRAEAVAGNDCTKATLDARCTDDSSENVKTAVTDTLTSAHAATEADVSTMEHSVSSDKSFPVTTSSPGPETAVTTPSKTWVACTIKNTEVTNGSVTEIKKSTTIPGLSDTSPWPTRVDGTSTLDLSAFSDSTGAKSHSTETTTSFKTLSTASATESATPGSTVETAPTTNNIKERETTAEDFIPSETSVTTSTHFLEEATVLSAETVSNTDTSEALPTEVQSTVEKTAPVAALATGSPSLVAIIETSAPSETFTTDSRTSKVLPTSRDPLPSLKVSTTQNSQGANMTLAKVTTSVESLTDPTTSRIFPTSRDPLSSLRVTTANNSQGTHTTLAETTASVEIPRDTTTSGTFPTGSTYVPSLRVTTANNGQGAHTTLAKTTTSVETLTDTTTSRTFPPSSAHIPSLRMTTANSNQVTHSTSAKATISVKTLTDTTTSRTFPMSSVDISSLKVTTTNSKQGDKTTPSEKTPVTANTTRGKPATTTPTAAQTKLTTRGGDGGFLLLRLNVASSEDLTDLRVADGLMKLLHSQLHAHMPLIKVSLLRVARR